MPLVTLSPGQTYLIQEGTERGGVINLINLNLVVGAVVNFDGCLGLAIGLTSRKVALASNNTQVTGPAASNFLDFVGYGLVNQYEGSWTAQPPTILNSITRTSGDNNNNNAADFTVTLPSPSWSVLAVTDLIMRLNNHILLKIVTGTVNNQPVSQKILKD